MASFAHVTDDNIITQMVDQLTNQPVPGLYKRVEQLGGRIEAITSVENNPNDCGYRFVAGVATADSNLPAMNILSISES